MSPSTLFATGHAPTLDEILEPLRSELDLINKLAETPQDPVWHGEGNVWIHTGMVLEALYGHLDGLDISDEERTVLALSAALHDIAKPLVTRSAEIDGRQCVVAPRHADLGRSYLAPRLMAQDWPFERLWQVLSLVGHHHDPLKLVRTDAGPSAYRRLARQASPRLLHALETADLRGRICDDLQEQLEMLDLFALAAEDVGEPADHVGWKDELDHALRHEPERVRRLGYLQALRDAEAGRIGSAHEAVARAYAFREACSEAVILCGPSGSGKSTWIETHGHGATVISLDALRDEMGGRKHHKKIEGRVAQEAKQRFKAALARCERVIWDATSLRREHRSELVGIAESYGAVVTIVVFLQSIGELHERNRRRRHSVPDEVLDRQIRQFDLPYPAESHVLKVFDGDGRELASFP